MAWSRLRRFARDLELPAAIRFFRVTRRGLFVLTLLFLIGMATFSTGNNLLVLVLSVILAALIVSGIASNLVLHGLKIRLNLPDGIYAGCNVILFLTVLNTKTLLPSFALCLKGSCRSSDEQSEKGTDFFETRTLFPYLSPGGQLRARLECSFGRRGRYLLDGFSVTTDFPFGFFTRGRQIPTDGVITVYPAPVDLGELFRRQPRLQGLETYQEKGTGSGLFNIRDYHHGDSARLVHWKSSAKAARLMVKELIRDEDHPLEVVFSTFLPHLSAVTLAQFEKVVSYLASLVTHYQKRAVPLQFRSGEFRRVAVSPLEYQEVMNYLACVQASATQLVDESSIGPTAVLFAAGPNDRRWAVDYLTL